jgi:putative MATE family efflux protein
MSSRSSDGAGPEEVQPHPADGLAPGRMVPRPVYHVLQMRPLPEPAPSKPDTPPSPHKDRGLGRLVWAVSLPLLFAQINEALIHVSDTFFLVGTPELAAIALAETIFEVWIVLCFGVVDGLQIFVARRAGEGRDAAVGATFSRAIVLLVGISVALTLSLKWASPHLVPWFVESKLVAERVNDFLQIAAYGIVLYSVGLAFAALFVGLQRTRVLVGATVALAVTNLFLDYILIFGKLGFPPLGIKGAAIAFVGSEMVAVVYLTVHAWRQLDLRRHALFRLGRGDPGIMRRLMRTSSPVAGQALVETLRWLLFFLIVERIGTQALAASSVIYACLALLLIPTDAFAETAQSLVSRTIGGSRSDSIPSVVGKVVSATYWVTLPFAVLALLFPTLVLSAFTSDGAVIGEATGALRVVAVGMIVLVPAEGWFAALLGTGATTQMLLIEIGLTTVVVSGAYLSGIVLGLSLPLVWIWECFAWALCFFVARRVVRMETWRRLTI